MDIDAVRLNFNPASLVALNAILAFVLFGVALYMKVSDFTGIRHAPRATLIGLIGQFLLLPAAAYLLGRWLHQAPSIALGMMLVSACPGGNISNFLTHFARGTGLSHTDFGHFVTKRRSQTAPASAFQCSTEPPGMAIS